MMKVRFSTFLLVLTTIAISFSEIIQILIFGSDYTNEISYNFYILDFTGLSYQNIEIVFTMQIVNAQFSESNYQLDATINKSPPNYIHFSQDQSTIEVGFHTSFDKSLLYITNLKNPLYSSTYQVNYKITPFESITKFRKILPATSQNLMSLTLNTTTGNIGSAVLSIKPVFQLPAGSILLIQLPSYSQEVASLNFVENPVFCFQGDVSLFFGDGKRVSSYVYLNKTMVIPTYASTVSGAPETGFLIWLSGFRSPASTRPYSIPLIHYVGGDNQLDLMQQINQTFSVSTASDPKLVSLQSSNIKTLASTSFIFKIQSRSFFNSDTVVNIKFPAEFGFSSFSSNLKAYDSFGAVLSLNPNSNNSTITVYNSYLVGSTDLLWMRIDGIINSVGALTTSNAFEIRVYDDSTMQYKYHKDTSSLFYTTKVNSLQIKQVLLSDLRVQMPSVLSITFGFADGLSDSTLVSTRLSIFLPEELSFGASTLQAMKFQGKLVCTTLTQYFTWTGSSSNSMCILEGESTLRVYEFFQQGSSTEITLILKDIENPLSSAKTQPILIEIDGITGASTNWTSLYTSEDSSESMRITATAGSILVTEFKSIGETQTFDLGAYRISFTLSSKIPSLGFIELKFPSDFVFQSMRESDFSCIFVSGLSISQTLCSFLPNNNTILFTLGQQQMLTANSRVTVVLNGVRNPRSLRPTNLITISSYLGSRVAPIDEIKSSHDPVFLSITMTTFRTLTVLSINPASFYIGQITSYTVSLFADTPIFSGDILVIDFGQIDVQSSASQSQTGIVCNGLEQSQISVECSATNNFVYIQFINSIQFQIQFSIQIKSLKNPSSALSISTPLQLTLSDEDIYSISSTSYLTVPKRDSRVGFDAAPLRSLEVFPESDEVGAETTYQIQFKTPIQLLANNHYLNAELSSEVSIPNQEALGCFVIIMGIMPSTRVTCSFSKLSNSVDISGFYPISAKNRLLLAASDILEGATLQIRVTGLKNKVKSGLFSNSAAGRFNIKIQTTSADSKVVVLAESSIIPSVSFVCNDTCLTCSGTAVDCTSCEDGKLLQIDQKRCIESCGQLYARIGNSCQRCTLTERDPNCVACSSSDLSECIKCDSKYILSSSMSTSTGICELISNENQPEKNFIYDSQWNLPIILLFLIITGVFATARRCYSIKSLRVGVVLLVLWSAIESLTLIVFTVKVMILPSAESVFIAGVVLLGYVILHGVFSVRLNRTLLQDGGFMLYQPNYDTIKVIQAAFRFNNVKAILAYRSQFSFIRDIYCIPFTNAVHLQAMVRQALLGSLSVSLLLIIFNTWVMYFTYNYRLVLLPPFFFIEFQIFHVSLAILIMLLLFSKDKSPLSLVQVLAPASEELAAGFTSTAGRALTYKQPQLDITQKSTSFITYATKKGNGGNEEATRNVSRTGVYIRSSEMIPQHNQSVSVMAGESMIGLVGKNSKKQNENEDDNNHFERKPSQQFQLRYLCSTTLTPQASQAPAANQNNISLTQDGNLSNCSSNQDLRIIPRFSSSQSSISPSSANSGLNTPVKQGVLANRFVKLPRCLSGQESESFIDNNGEDHFQADPAQLQTAQFEKGSPEKEKRSSAKKYHQSRKENGGFSAAHQFVPFSDGGSQEQNLIISSTSSIRISQQQRCEESEHQFTIKIEDIHAEVKTRPIRSRKHHQKSMTIELEASTSSAKKKRSPAKSEEQCSEKYTESTEKEDDNDDQNEAAATRTTVEASQLNSFLINNSNPTIRSPGNSTRLKSPNTNSPPQSHGTPQLGRVEQQQNSRQLQQQYQQDHHTQQNPTGIGAKATEQRKQEEDEFAKVEWNQLGSQNAQVRSNNHIAVPVPQQLWSFSQNKEATTSSKQCVSQFDHPGDARQTTDTAVSPHTTIPLHDPQGSLFLPNRSANNKAGGVPFHES